MGQDLIAAAFLALAMGLATQASGDAHTRAVGGPEILAGGDSAECPGAVLYKEPPGVAFEPGVDAYGRAVAPASPAQVPPPRISEEIAFTLKLNPLTEAGLDGERFEGTELTVSEVEVNLHSGALALDGRQVVAASRCPPNAGGPVPRPKPAMPLSH